MEPMELLGEISPFHGLRSLSILLKFESAKEPLFAWVIFINVYHI